MDRKIAVQLALMIGTQLSAFTERSVCAAQVAQKQRMIEIGLDEPTRLPHADPDTSFLEDPAVGPLLREARRHDAAYVPDEHANREAALRAYEQVFNANPSSAVKLYVLFRMAHLHAVNFHWQHGERPNHRASIALCSQIVTEFPPRNPDVFRAFLLMGDSYLAVWQFDKAVQSYRNALQAITDCVDATARRRWHRRRCSSDR